MSCPPPPLPKKRFLSDLFYDECITDVNIDAKKVKMAMVPRPLFSPELASMSNGHTVSGNSEIESVFDLALGSEPMTHIRLKPRPSSPKSVVVWTNIIG